MIKFKFEYIILDPRNKEAHYNQIVKVLDSEGAIPSAGLRKITIRSIHIQLYENGRYQIYNFRPSNADGEERKLPFVPEVKFKDEYIMLDLDNREDHYEQVVKVLKSEGGNFYKSSTFFERATHIRCYRDGRFAYYSSIPDLADGPERKLPYIPAPERLTLTDNILTVNGKTRYTLTEIEEEEKEFTISQVFLAVSHFSNGGAWKHDVRDFFNNLES